jgi:hyperosmotically inducible periplasmic protein
MAENPSQYHQIKSISTESNQMKTRAKLFLISTTLLGLLTLAGCNKPQDTAVSTNVDSTVATELQDAEVTAKVKAALLLDETIKSLDITVVTTKGDVRLTGVVDTQAQLDQIDTMVRDIEGVHSFHDELTIKQ